MGTTFDKKTYLRAETKAASADALSKTVKENLRDALFLKDGEHAILYIPEERSERLLASLHTQYGVVPAGQVEHPWNNEAEEIEHWLRIDLPDFAIAPIEDAIKRKVVSPATWRELAGDTPFDALTQLIEARTVQHGK